MPAVVGDEVGGFVAGPDEFRIGVQQNGGLDFPRMHIAEQRGLYPGTLPRRFPVLGRREESHPRTGGGGFLNDVAQYVVSAVSVDKNEGVHTRPAQRVGDVPHHRMKSHGGNAHRSRPGRVFVRAGDRHRRKEVNGECGSHLPGDRAGDERVGRQRKIRSVLLEAAHGKHGDLPGDTGASCAHILRGVPRQGA
ncbi:hypothetical protein GCM10010515_69500 [Streptomyces fructofermentans]|uniref:Uncharacterized protein n=1 Tax=Streptomyces fructofermentans TaxID=152141 RepID=A0A918NSS8_9ACTN|nr:hypothetical protein GCM10010515_69500 [Streptomyces fructofermentans]